jgi:ketosteroid isomerase-like protein
MSRPHRNPSSDGVAGFWHPTGGAARPPHAAAHDLDVLRRVRSHQQHQPAHHPHQAQVQHPRTHSRRSCRAALPSKPAGQRCCASSGTVQESPIGVSNSFTLCADLGWLQLLGQVHGIRAVSPLIGGRGGDVLGNSELQRLTGELLARLDAREFEAITGIMEDEVQGVDEISRGWLRGHSAAEEYFQTALANVSNIKSSLSDVSVVETGDVGIVTGLLSQSYTHEGQSASIEAPRRSCFCVAVRTGRSCSSTPSRSRRPADRPARRH